jgi:ABC-type polysaccharide/polyol phosphate export permease
MVRRELKVKYRGSFFGYLWSMLNPLLSMLIMSAVFSSIVKGIPNYAAYVLSGLLAWQFAQTTMLLGTHSIINGSGLLRKIRIPMWVFPMVPLGMASVNFCLALVPFSVIWFFMGGAFLGTLVWIPLIGLLFSVFLLGVNVALSTLNVRFRDVGHILEPVLQLIFYATPVIYDRNALPLNPIITKILSLNPVTHYVEAIRFCLIGQNGGSYVFQAKEFGALALLSVGSLIVGFLIYRINKREIMFSL